MKFFSENFPRSIEFHFHWSMFIFWQIPNIETIENVCLIGLARHFYLSSISRWKINFDESGKRARGSKITEAHSLFFHDVFWYDLTYWLFQFLLCMCWKIGKNSPGNSIDWVFMEQDRKKKKTTEKPTISLIVSNRHRLYSGTALTLFKFKLQLHKWLSRRIVEYWMDWKKKIQFICHDLFKQSSNHRGDDSIKAERKFAACSVKWVYFPVSFDFWLKCRTIENCRSTFRRLFIY